MSGQAVAFAVIFGALLGNQAIMRTAVWHRRPVFLAMQAVNAALAVGIALYGVPGFESAPGYRAALCLVFVFRLVWNGFEARNLAHEAHREALDAERERLLAQIHRDEE